MNSLKRKIKGGEEIVLSNDIFTEEYTTLERTFIVESGKGCDPNEKGTEIFGYWSLGNQPDVVPGDKIDAEETESHNRG